MGLLRRTFLRSGLFSLPALGLSASKASAQSGQTDAFVVTAGKCRQDGPWTVHGEPAFFDKIAGADVGGRISVLEVKTPPGQGPPMHIHLVKPSICKPHKTKPMKILPLEDELPFDSL